MSHDPWHGRRVLALLAPPVCLVCGGPGERGAVLCPPCEAALPRIGAPLTMSFGVAYAPFAHAGVARDLLLALKLRRARPAVAAMARQMLACVPPGVLADATVVPVPSWTAERLAEGVGRAARRPVVACLQRVPAGAGTRQLGRARAARHARDGLAVTDPAPPPGRVVLVDDVHTTGATLGSGASALRAAGFLHIAAMTYVRTLTSA